MEYRYYEVPLGEYILPKLGEGWEQVYGLGKGRMLHFHNHLEVGYCYHGDGEMIISDTSYFYKGGEFTLIPENIPHTTLSSPGHICKWEYLFIDMNSFLREVMLRDDPGRDAVVCLLSQRGFFLTEKEYPLLAGVIRRMMEECREKKNYYRESLKGLLTELAVEMLRLSETEVEIPFGKREPGYVEAAIRYMYENYPKNIQMPDVAAACGLSESHFRRIFLETMHMKPVDFLNQIRIQEACRLMERENDPIRDICLQVGYETFSTFNRNFHKVTGTSPQQWRKEKKGTAGAFREFHISALRGWEVKDFSEVIVKE